MGLFLARLGMDELQGYWGFIAWSYHGFAGVGSSVSICPHVLCLVSLLVGLIGFCWIISLEQNRDCGAG